MSSVLLFKYLSIFLTYSTEIVKSIILFLQTGYKEQTNGDQHDGNKCDGKAGLERSERAKTSPSRTVGRKRKNGLPVSTNGEDSEKSNDAGM